MLLPSYEPTKPTVLDRPRKEALSAKRWPLKLSRQSKLQHLPKTRMLVPNYVPAKPIASAQRWPVALSATRRLPKLRR